MQKWLLKTEPSCWSWDDQMKHNVTHWDDVRNFQAQKFMRSMLIGDEAFFYHTGKEKCIVGIVRIVSSPYPDKEAKNENQIMVDIQTQRTLPHPVTLATIKSHPQLQHLALIKQSRLSVVPIDDQSWNLILNLPAL
ncbi:MAG: EVE domain-containing protein [Alphaproteobacteria bacterium]|nr:EVE domain-containing protein [Alphaproteobacteria bacterium]